MQARHSHLQAVLQVGEDLIKADNLGSSKIQQRINEINSQWDSLLDLAGYRKKRLLEAVDFYQVRSSKKMRTTISYYDT